MSKEERQRVKFTGKRTGLSGISIKGVGLVEKGDTIEIAAETAEAWTTPKPMRDGKEGTDWTKVGGTYKLEPGESAQNRMMQREKHQPDAVEDVLLSDASTEAAHPEADTGTVEEEAEAKHVEDAKAEAPAEKATKKA